ncbi:MAG: thiamine-phosphate kinase [Chloroflexota bacterium]
MDAAILAEPIQIGNAVQSLNKNTLAGIGELRLIDRIRSITGQTNAIIGIGDDAAVIDQPGDAYLLATIDAQVQGVHFRSAMPAREAGRRAMAVNVSDIAAMGGTPTFALVSLVLPSDTTQEFFDELFAGLSEEAREYGTGIAGGNISSTRGPAVIDIALLGSVPKTEVVLRSGAKPGDILAVSGPLGTAAVALRAHELRDSMLQSEQEWAESYDVPMARSDLGVVVARKHLAHAMIDISDGLSSDLHHLCEASEVGALVRLADIRIDATARCIAAKLGLDASDLALNGGEDYELLAAIPPHAMREAERAGFMPIGEILPSGEGVMLESADGKRSPLEPRGWRHF